MHMKNTLKNIAHIVCAGGIVGFLTFTSMITVAHAETIVTDGFLQGDTVWDKAHSPYILNDVVTVPSGIKLIIKPGVEVRADPVSDYQPYIYVAGTLLIQGSVEEPVQIGDIWGINVDYGSAYISNTTLAMRSSLRFVGAEGHIFTSTISNSVGDIHSDGIYSENSLVTIQGSKIEGNINGIVVKEPVGVFQMRKDTPSILGSVQNTLEKIGLIKIAQAATLNSPKVSITDSSLLNNNQAAIFNDTAIDVQADHNWWGNAGGPQSTMIQNNIQGLVIYNPWLDHDPTAPQVAVCCSSVLFLPGLEASRLYRPESGPFGIGMMTNRLWEPNRNADVVKLFMDSNGSSTDTSIYAGGPIDKALGLIGIYGSFMNFLDGLSQKGTIAEWKSFGYDWRKPIAEVVAGRTQRATTTDSLLETVESLAERSKTGKVTLIAHSNGGLVAKYLVKTLVDLGKENLIDSVISVAVPYLGTPQAILGLLHGDGQDIAGGIILKKSVAKELGTNMPSAYSLLPSAGYFEKVFGPTIAYASGSATPITSVVAQDSFIGTRANQTLMTAAEILHGILDPFSWPATIARWAIVGWGNKTAKGIVYSGANNSKYNATTTSMGDGTVVAPSAAYNAGTTTAIDLLAVSGIDRRSTNHANILGASATQSAIEDLITVDNHNSNAKSIESALVKIPGVTIGEPDYSKEATFLVVSTHSPVDLNVYDSQGNHTGVAPMPTSTDENIEDGLFIYVEKNIPGSSFEQYGDENQPETYISLPDDSGQTYSVAIQGTGVGEFTYNVQRIRGGDVLDSVTYGSLPVTPLMTASTTVSSQIGVPDATGAIIPIKLASSTPTLKIDVDGNGSVDIIAKANVAPDPMMFLEALKKTVVQLIGSNNRSKNILKRIDHLEELVKKGKFKKIHDNVEKLKKIVTHKKNKVLSDTEKTQIIDMIDVFLAQFE